MVLMIYRMIDAILKNHKDHKNPRSILTTKLLHQALQRMQRLNTRLAPHNLPLFKQNHGWDAPNLILLRGCLRLVHVNFNDTNFIADSFRELFQDGGLLFAGTAPVSIEIDQHRGVALDQVFKRWLVHKLIVLRSPARS